MFDFFGNPGLKEMGTTVQAHTQSVRSYRSRHREQRPKTVSNLCPSLLWVLPTGPPALVWAGGAVSLLPKGLWEGLSTPCSQPGLEERGSERTLFLTLRKFPSVCKVRFSPPDHNEYKQDWFVHSLCVLSSLALTGSGSGGRK